MSRKGIYEMPMRDVDLLLMVSKKQLLYEVYFSLIKISSYEERTLAINQPSEEENQITCKLRLLNLTTKEKSSIVNLLLLENPRLCKNTVRTMINCLIKIGILSYSTDINCFYFSNSINMCEKKISTGYCSIQAIFFSNIFFDKDLIQKRLMLYSLKIMNYNKPFGKIMINLSKEQVKVLTDTSGTSSDLFIAMNSKNINYIRDAINELIREGFFVDISRKRVQNTLEKHNSHLSEDEREHRAKKDTINSFDLVPTPLFGYGYKSARTHLNYLKNTITLKEIWPIVDKEKSLSLDCKAAFLLHVQHLSFQQQNSILRSFTIANNANAVKKPYRYMHAVMINRLRELQ
jgi:hypothetical protein